ncbi:MAG: hypothetical protein Q8O79_02720 [Pseudomonadota bacterium]|nr:hypothetical protein [Pseudomonadota bacterium]
MKRSISLAVFLVVLNLAFVPGFAIAGWFGDGADEAKSSRGDVVASMAVMPYCDKPLAAVRFAGIETPMGEERSAARKMDLLSEKSGCLTPLESKDGAYVVISVETANETKRMRDAIRDARASADGWRWVPIISRIGARASVNEALKGYGMDLIVLMIVRDGSNKPIEISAIGPYEESESVFLSAYERLIAQLRIILKQKTSN